MRTERRLWGVSLALAVACWSLSSGLAWSAPAAAAPAQTPLPAGLTAKDLGLVINENDPLSVQIGEYYQQHRGIAPENVVRVRMSVQPALSRLEFARVSKEVQERLPSGIQVLALAWSQPFRVDCMSITSAFAFGFDSRQCADGCQPTPFSVYFDSSSHMPYKDLRIRPTMMLAARTFDEARALIDRGVAADGTAPRGTAYLLDTSDANRNKRAPSFTFARGMAGDGIGVQVVKADLLRNRADILFYFTGVMRVAELHSNKFLPGALADHLTSAGGVLSGTDQMTVFEWLEAGATASYGTVIEPCNFPGKFPNIPVVMRHYLDGETAVEAYWKSVLMPSQGIFVGEPLAAPFRGPNWTGINEAKRQLHAAAAQH